eukprot:363395-Chlamydomonas_euryale.AAC.4
MRLATPLPSGRRTATPAAAVCSLHAAAAGGSWTAPARGATACRPSGGCSAVDGERCYKKTKSQVSKDSSTTHSRPPQLSLSLRLLFFLGHPNAFHTSVQPHHWCHPSDWLLATSRQQLKEAAC